MTTNTWRTPQNEGTKGPSKQAMVPVFLFDQELSLPLRRHANCHQSACHRPQRKLARN